MASEMSVKRMTDLERRVYALEERVRQALWDEDKYRTHKEAELIAHYGEYVDKTRAAQILGVTRATVYAMLADGRVLAACGGRKVNVRSIARYLTEETIHPEESQNTEKKEETEGKRHECA